MYKQGAKIFQPEVPDTTRYFACDTEVAFLDIKSESPVRGRVHALLYVHGACGVRAWCMWCTCMVHVVWAQGDF